MNVQTEKHHPAMKGDGKGIDQSTKVIYSNKYHQQVIGRVRRIVISKLTVFSAPAG